MNSLKSTGCTTVRVKQTNVELMETKCALIAAKSPQVSKGMSCPNLFSTQIKRHTDTQTTEKLDIISEGKKTSK